MASNSDLQVQQILFSPSVLCNCPTDVRVVLINVGNAAPMPTSSDGGYEVCLQSAAFRAEVGNLYRLRVGGREGPHLPLPGQTLTVTFRNVVFVRAGHIQVTACADCEGTFPSTGRQHFEIGNDLHTRPCLKVYADVIPAAFLQIDQLEIELEDSLGNRNRNASQLCPGSKYVAVATVSNRGCADAQNFTAQLTILDQNGQAVATVNQSVSVVNALLTVPVELRGTVPVRNAAGAAYSFRVCLDVTNRVRPQCNRQRLCMTSPLIPVAPQRGPGATVSFIVNNASASPLFPGQAIPISWRIQNDCSDLGDVTARVTLKATGDLLYDSGVSRGPIPVAPLDSGGEPFVLIPRPALPAVAAALYQMGAKVLHIDVAGTGQNPGPYGADAPLVISGEDPGPDWWNWGLTGTSHYWKEAYDVGGTLTNLTVGGAALTVQSVTFTEFDDDVRPPAATGNTYNPPLPSGALNPGASVDFVWQTILQQWTWLSPIGWRIVGPLQKNFGYEADLRLADEFGNAYRFNPRL